MAKIATRINTATAHEVRTANPLLSAGEPFYESDTGGFKIGDGSLRYNDLQYTGIVLERTGIQGEQGIQGIKGDKGDIGNTGSQGLSAYQVAVANGYVGTEAAWIASLKGVKGDTGLKGDKGDKGDTGTQGLQGVKGDQGIQGVKGDQGIQGVQGPTAGWDTIVGKPTVVSAGATKAEARTTIDAVGSIRTEGANIWYGTQTEFDALSSGVKNAVGFIGFIL